MTEEIQKTADALSVAVLANDADKIGELSGRMAFLTVAAAQTNEVDAEESLYHECTRFTDVLTEAEKECGEISGLSTDERRNLSKIAYFLS